MMAGSFRHEETVTSETIVSSRIPQKILGLMFRWCSMVQLTRLLPLNLGGSFLRKIETLRFVVTDLHLVVLFLTT